MPPHNDQNELFRESIRELKENQKDMWTLLQGLRIEIAVLKTKLGMYGAFGGLLGAALIELARHFLDKH